MVNFCISSPYIKIDIFLMVWEGMMQGPCVWHASLSFEFESFWNISKQIAYKLRSSAFVLKELIHFHVVLHTIILYDCWL